MSAVELQTEEEIATITLNRPEKLNALAGTMRQELVDAIHTADSDPSTRVLIITGAGGAFCAGGDIEFMKSLQSEGRLQEFRELLDAGKAVVMSIRSASKPVIAAINGVAAGAGCNLALACDYRFAAEGARLGQTFVRIGLHPDWGGTYFLPRLVGVSRALEIMMSGRMVDAAEALKIGMVDRLAPGDELLKEARHFAAALASAPPIAIEGIKRAVYASFANTLEEQLTLESLNQLRAFQSSDAAEGLAAFTEKRVPRFSGS